jgi:hypothetical protein
MIFMISTLCRRHLRNKIVPSERETGGLVSSQTTKSGAQEHALPLQLQGSRSTERSVLRRNSPSNQNIGSRRSTSAFLCKGAFPSTRKTTQTKLTQMKRTTASPKAHETKRCLLVGESCAPGKSPPVK